MLFCNNSSNIVVEHRRHIMGILCKIHLWCWHTVLSWRGRHTAHQSVCTALSVRADMSITGDIDDLFRDFIPVLPSEYQW